MKQVVTALALPAIKAGTDAVLAGEYKRPGEWDEKTCWMLC